MVKNVLYEDIRVEDSRGYLIDFKILKSRYSKDKQRGYIQDIHFRNIQVEGDVFPTSLIMGFDEEHRVSGVILEDVRIHGRLVKRAHDALITTIHADGIQYR